MRSEGQQKMWDALTSTGGDDFVATVIFDERGTVMSVDVRMPVPSVPEPTINFVPLLRPGIQREGKQDIPEAMPK
jgi:hypothetical protein